MITTIAFTALGLYAQINNTEIPGLPLLVFISLFFECIWIAGLSVPKKES